jgi:type III secretion protein C
MKLRRGVLSRGSAERWPVWGMNRAHWLAMGLVAAPLIGEVPNSCVPELNQEAQQPAEAPSLPVAAPQPVETLPAAQATVENTSYRLNFTGVSAVEVSRFIGKLAKLNLIFDEKDLNFPITMVAHEKTPIPELVAALTQVLRAHGLSITEQGNNLLISKVPSGQTLASIVSDEQHNVDRPPAGLITRVFRLSNIQPTVVSGLIKPLLSPQAAVEPSDTTSQLIVTDLSANVGRVEELLHSLDTPVSPLEINLYQPASGDLASLMTLTQKILQPIAGNAPLVMVPQESTGTLYLVSTPYLMNQAMALLRVLDVPMAQATGVPIDTGNNQASSTNHTSPTPLLAELLPASHMDRTEFTIYKLAYQRGDTIEHALRETASTLERSADMNHELLCAIRSVKWLEHNNTLVFTGSPEALSKVRKLVDDLDVALRQVYIEMLIVQTELSDSLTFGVDWAINGNHLFNDNLNAGTAFDPNNTGIINAVSSVTADGPIPDVKSLFNPVDFGLGVIGRAIRKGGEAFVTMGSLIQALAKDSETKILLTPRILAQDNTTATLFVGQNVPYQTTVITSTASTNFQGTLDYRDVGTTLQITPLIGQGDVVTLEVAQTVATISSTTTVVQSGSGGSFSVIAPTTNTTTTTTRLHVPDGYFVIMSGMVTDQQIRQDSHVPCLGSIPWVGKLFTKTDNSDSKRDTMIFIRPRIIRSVDALMDVTEHSKDDVTSAYESGIMLPQLQQSIEVLGPPPPLPSYCCPSNSP